MGSIREQVGKKKTTYLARVRRNGVVDTATFDEKSDAKNWILQQESDIISGKPVDISKMKKLSLSEMFQDYIDNGKINEEKQGRLNRLTMLLGNLKFGDFNSRTFENFIGEMLDMDVPRPDTWIKPHPYCNGSMIEVDGNLVRRKLNPSTVRKYYYEIRTCFMWHSKMYDYHFDNKPFQDNTPPKAWNQRDRVIEEENGELEKLLSACDKMYVNQENLKDIIKFQIYSAMRMGETLLMQKQDIFLFEKEPWRSYILVPKEHQKTRNHESTDDRFVLMIPELYELVKNRILPRLKEKKANDRAFPFWKNSSALSQRFRVIWKNTGIKDMKAHDWRHTALTYLFENTNLTDIEIAKMSGHTDINTLKRYHKFRANGVGSKLWKSLGAMPEQAQK